MPDNNRHWRIRVNGVRHLFGFFAAALMFLGIFVALTSSLSTLRHEESFDFKQLGPNQTLATFSLTRRQNGSVKLGYIEQEKLRPRLGIFGNHQIVPFGSAHMGLHMDNGSFFNYAFANLGLAEVRDQLFYLSQENLLPRDLIVVQITTPNNDNGNHIVKFGNELPPDIRQPAMKNYNLGFADWASAKYEDYSSRIKTHLNYANILIALFGGKQHWVINPDDCARQKPAPAWVRFIPGTIRMTAGLFADDLICARKAGALYRDGSAVPPKGGRGQWLDSGVIDKNKSKLVEGDDAMVATYMRQIYDISRKAGAKVVFIILPLYESDTPERRNSMINRIMDKALARVPEIQVIDHRRIFLGKKYFDNFDHPGNQYYEEILAPEICRAAPVLCSLKTLTRTPVKTGG